MISDALSDEMLFGIEDMMKSVMILCHKSYIILYYRYTELLNTTFEIHGHVVM